MNTINLLIRKYNNSQQYSGFNNSTKPNNTSSQNVSFKGSATLITEADRKILNVFSQHYGNIGERLGQKVGKLVTSSKLLDKSSRFSLEKGALSIRDKKISEALTEHILFPFINLPLYAASWVLKKCESIPNTTIQDAAKKIYNKPLLRLPRKLNELDSKTDMIKGIFDKTQDVVKKFAKENGVSPEYLLEQLNKTDDTPQAKQLVKEANEFIKENLYKVSNKFFDKHTGNFNTAYERPLNRIVTGLIPVVFLANDAYNLSVLCGDTKEQSKKEAKERQKQEISRVFTTAYIQLLTFGAFTKQVNTISWFTPLTSAVTVLFSEITSRKRLGKPIFFLSKEKAKEYNLNNKKTTKSNADTKSQKIQQEKDNNTQINIKQSNPEVFTSFKSSVENKSNGTDKNIAEKSQENKSENKEPKKALINFKTFKNGVAVLVTAGFVLSFLKNSSYTKNSKLIKGIKNFADKCTKKIYNPFAYKDFQITQREFENLSNSLKNSGCKEIAEGHEFIKNKYGKETTDGIIKMYKGMLPSSMIPDTLQTIIDKIKNNNTALTDKEISQISDSVKTAINLEKTSIAEKKYERVARKASEIINNKKININAQESENLTKIITETIAQNAKEVPIQVDTDIKPFIDIVTQPFKFIMSALKLPFKITSSFIKILVTPIENKASEAALGKAELSKFEKSIHKVVTEIFGEKGAKTGKISQVVFANSMEQLEKQTRPYRKANMALNKAIKDKLSDVEIQKAADKLELEKNKLARYVNTAVEKSFNGVTQSSNKNTDLAMMSKLASSAVTSAFLVADNYNMVMLKSNGEDKEGAKEKANERIIQRLSALFYQTLLINWFNATFRAQYNSSLKGMASIAVPNTLTTEILTRKSIGMPVGRKSLEELQEIDEKNDNRKGLVGKYFKFMRLLTGKKPLKDRLPKNENTKVNNNVQNNSSTNLLEIFANK